MSAPSEFHFYEDSFNRLSSALSTYVGDTAGNIISAISGVAYSMLMIYMMLWGWTMLREVSTESAPAVPAPPGPSDTGGAPHNPTAIDRIIKTTPDLAALTKIAKRKKS